MSAPFQINFGPSSSNVDGGEGFAARCKDLFDVLSSHAPKKTREETQTGNKPVLEEPSSGWMVASFTYLKKFGEKRLIFVPPLF